MILGKGEAGGCASQGGGDTHPLMSSFERGSFRGKSAAVGALEGPKKS